MNIIFSISVKISSEKTSRETQYTTGTVIKLPVVKVHRKSVNNSINKQQRFPAVSNFNEFDALTRKIGIGTSKVCKT